MRRCTVFSNAECNSFPNLYGSRTAVFCVARSLHQKMEQLRKKISEGGDSARRLQKYQTYF
jgi:hypothetical protein